MFPHTRFAFSGGFARLFGRQKPGIEQTVPATKLSSTILPPFPALFQVVPPILLSASFFTPLGRWVGGWGEAGADFKSALCLREMRRQKGGWRRRPGFLSSLAHTRFTPLSQPGSLGVPSQPFKTYLRRVVKLFLQTYFALHSRDIWDSHSNIFETVPEFTSMLTYIELWWLGCGLKEKTGPFSPPLSLRALSTCNSRWEEGELPWLPKGRYRRKPPRIRMEA